MSVLRRIIATPFAFLAAWVLSLSLLCYGMERSLLRDDFWKRALVENHFYDDVVPRLLSRVAIDQISVMRPHAVGVAIDQTKEDVGPNALSGTRLAGGSMGSLDLVHCLRATLDQEDIMSLSLGESSLTDIEMDVAAACLSQDSTHNVETLIPSASQPDEASGQALLAALMQAMSDEDLQHIVALLFPGTWVQTQVESVIDTFFLWPESAAPYPHVVVDLSQIKQHFTGAPASEASRLIVSRMPFCTGDDREIPRHDLLSDNDPERLCRSAPGSDTLVQGPGEWIEASFRSIGASFLPDEVVLFSSDLSAAESDVSGPSISLDQALLIKAAIKWIRWWARWGFAVVGGLLLMVAFIVEHSLDVVSRWWGTSLIAAGTIVALPLGTVWLVSVNRLYLTPPSGLSSFVFDSTRELLMAVVAQVVIPIVMIALWITVIGLAGRILGGIFRNRWSTIGSINQSINQSCII